MCRALADGPVADVHADGARRQEDERGMLCLGRHWNGLTYSYEDRRDRDFDGRPAPPIPKRSPISRGAPRPRPVS